MEKMLSKKNKWRRLMVKFKFKVLYTKDVGKKMVIAFVQALDAYHQYLYPIILAATPTYKGSDPRRSPGFVRSQIKLIPARMAGRTYMTIGVPGASAKGSDAYHAWNAIQAAHYGWAGPFIRYPSNKKTMYFPATGKLLRTPTRTTGMKGQWISTQRAIQTPNYPKNPWIERAWFNHSDKFTTLFNSLMNTKLKKKVKEESK